MIARIDKPQLACKRRVLEHEKGLGPLQWAMAFMMASRLLAVPPLFQTITIKTVHMIFLDIFFRTIFISLSTLERVLTMHCSSVAPECCCWFHVRLLFAGGSRRFRGLHVVRTQSHGYHCASTLCDHGAWAAAPAPWTQSPSLRRRPFKLRFVRFPHISSCSTRLAVQQPSLLVWCSAPRRCHGVYLYRGRHCAVDGTHLSHEARSRDPRADPIAKSNQQSSAEPGRQRTSHRSRHSRPERPGRCVEISGQSA